MGIHKTVDSFSLTRAQDGRLEVRTLCCECGKMGAINVKSSAHANVTSFIHRKFREIGWSLGNTRRRDLCRECVADGTPPTQPTTAFAEELEKVLDDVFTPAPVMKEKEKMQVVQITPPETPVEGDTKKKRVCLSRVEEMKIFTSLQKHLSQEEEFWKYSEGYTDSRIADECGVERATVDHVKNIRHDLFGKLRPRVLPQGSGGVSRMNALESRVAELEKMVLELIK